MLTLEGPPPELVNRTLRSAMTTTSLCSNSNNVLSKKGKNRILSRSVWGRTSNDIKKPNPPFNRTVTLMTSYLKGPQRVRPKKPRREMMQLMTECLRSLIHCNKDGWGSRDYSWSAHAVYDTLFVSLSKTWKQGKNIPVSLKLLSQKKMVFGRKPKSLHTYTGTRDRCIFHT